MNPTTISSKVALRKWLTSLVFGTIVGTIIFAIIIFWSGLGNVWNSFGSLDYAALSVYVGLAICTYLLRAWRFKLLVHRGTISKFYGIVSVHTLMVNLLPLSSGEISYPVLLRRYGVSEGFLQGIPSLLIARMQDIFINLSLILIALVWAGNLGLIIHSAGGSLTLVVVLPVVLAGGLGWLAYKAYKKVGKNFWLLRRISEFMAATFSAIKETSPIVWATTFLLTLAIRSVSLIGVFYLLRSVGVTLPLPTVFLLTSLYVFLPLLPVNTLAGLGITEAYLVTIFLIGGLDRSEATAASIQVHSLQLGVAIILGVIGLLLLQYLKKGTPVEHRGSSAITKAEEV